MSPFIFLQQSKLLGNLNDLPHYVILKKKKKPCLLNAYVCLLESRVFCTRISKLHVSSLLVPPGE